MDISMTSGIVVSLLVIYLALAVRWVPAPYVWVVEQNIPLPWIPGWMQASIKKMNTWAGSTAATVDEGNKTSNTTVLLWEAGFHLLWIPIKPIMYIRNKINVAHKPVTLHLGKKDGLGRADPVEFLDTKAGALIQVIYQVTDPRLATYAVEESELTIVSRTIHDEEFFETYLGYERAVLNLVEALFRGEFGSLTFDQANAGKIEEEPEKANGQLEASTASAESTEESEESPEITRDRIEKLVKQAAEEQLKDWGVELILVDIIDFSLDEATSNIRQKRLAAHIQAEVVQTEAQGQKKATIINAEAAKESSIIVAEGLRKTAELAGQGEQERIQMVTQGGLTPREAAGYILAQGSTEALGRSQTTVVATSEGGSLSQLAGMAGMVKGVLGGGGDNPPPKDPLKGSGHLNPTPDTPATASPEQKKGE